MSHRIPGIVRTDGPQIRQFMSFQLWQVSAIMAVYVTQTWTHKAFRVVVSIISTDEGERSLVYVVDWYSCMNNQSFSSQSTRETTKNHILRA